jgi:Family of unknown function (DUF6444)
LGSGEGVVVPDLALDGQLAVENAVLRAQNAGLRTENAVLRAEHEELQRMLALLTERVAELERRLACDSSNSSRPPSSDAPWSKKPAKKRSSRSRSGHKPGKQPGASSLSRSLVDDADDTLKIQPQRCRRCDASLEGGQGVRASAAPGCRCAAGAAAEGDRVPADLEDVPVLRGGHHPGLG